jgi:hypothetical protein
MMRSCHLYPETTLVAIQPAPRDPGKPGGFHRIDERLRRAPAEREFFGNAHGAPVGGAQKLQTGQVHVLHLLHIKRDLIGVHQGPYENVSEFFRLLKRNISVECNYACFP